MRREDIVWKSDKGIKLKEEGQTPYLAWDLPDELAFLGHGFSTRLGGVSQGHLASMNLGFQRGDRRENVEENYRRIAASMGFAPEDMVFSKQTHTCNVRLVTEADRGRGFVKEISYDAIDGLVTDRKGLILVGSFADCVPIYLADPVHRAVAILHSGWRGTVGNIAKRGIALMRESFGSEAGDLYAMIGPSICQDCYEIGQDVADEFLAVYPKEAMEGILGKGKAEGKYQLNLWEACRFNLLTGGIKDDKIFLPDLCTCCNPNLLYSHRFSKGLRGSLSAFIWIR